MRSILTLSMPADMLKKLKNKAKKKGVSVSYYVRMVIEHEENIISEEDLLKYCKEADEEYRTGKTRVLQNIKELAGNL